MHLEAEIATCHRNRLEVDALPQAAAWVSHMRRFWLGSVLHARSVQPTASSVHAALSIAVVLLICATAPASSAGSHTDHRQTQLSSNAPYAPQNFFCDKAPLKPIVNASGFFG